MVVMRIAQVAPLYESVPPRGYGGTERVISFLTEELVRLGHEVTLFASGDSTTSAELFSICPRALWGDHTVTDTLPDHMRQLDLVARQADQFEIVHFHGDPFHFPLTRCIPSCTITTLHGRLSTREYVPLFRQFCDAPLVSISNDQRTPVPGANWRGTVYHGLPEDDFELTESAGSYLLFLGRMMPEKRPDLAIEIALRSGSPLKMAARIQFGEWEYFRKEIEPSINRCRSAVEFLGEVAGRQREELIAGAKALLFPIDWAEPFGLVMIEAMACGTPVIAFRRGSVPEVLEDGVTGFIVDSVDQAVDAVGQLHQINRRQCRKVFEDRFTARRMTADYLAIYERLIKERRSARPKPQTTLN